MTHIINDTCKACKDTACQAVCPVDCIYPFHTTDTEQYYVQPEECIDCGLCIDACPVTAIAHQEEVPASRNADIRRNYEYFGLDSPV
jgi:ferredoxin